ncbi:MAG: hypothetical protein ABII09_11960 [Planctomycetota bacterium]
MLTQTLERKQNISTQIEIQQIQGLPVDTALLFSDHKGRYKKRLEKQQRKFLAKLGFLTPFLEQGEKILFITPGCSPFSTIEQLLTGVWIMILKRCLFVFTDKRVFHIPTKSNFAYRNSIAQILYADCSSLQIKRSSLVANYKNGSSEKFIGIPGGARKKITELLKNAAFDGRQSPMLERAHLCPRCTKPLVKGYYTCPHCSLEFKNKIKARRISVLLPGGGYFYTRNIALGILDAISETLLSVVLLVALVNTIRGDAEAAGALAFVAAILALEKFITIMHSSSFVDEFIPLDPNVSPRPQVILARSTSSGPAKGTIPSNSGPANTPLPKPEDILRNDWRSH